MCRFFLLALLFPFLTLLPATVRGADVDDAYIKGYASAILERQFGIRARLIDVKDGVVTISAADLPRNDRPQVRRALLSIENVKRVEFDEPQRAVAPELTAPRAEWLPPRALFRSLIADPRWPHFSASYRYYLDDSSGLRNAGAVSFGETLSIFRYHIDGSNEWELGLQPGVFSIFDLDSASVDLINTDFFLAAFGAYRHRSLTGMLRVFHQSSHLGDELLLRQTRPNRINLSYEGIDAKLSYDLPWGFRIYGGGGYLFHVNPSDLGRGSAQVGGEFRSERGFLRDWIRPVAGLDLQFREENQWKTDLSLRLGVELDSVSILNRNLQLLVEYFKGHSFEGQFFNQAVEYLGLSARFNF
jgi:hypothetical protein